MELAELAPVPPADLLKEVLPEELNAYLNSWLSLVQYHLRLSDELFRAREDSVTLFLTSYFSNLANRTESKSGASGLKDHLELKRWSFLLAHRALAQEHPPNALLQWTFLADLCHVVQQGQVLGELLRSVWRRKQSNITEEVYATKKAIVTSRAQDLEKATAIGRFLEHIAPLVQTLPEVGETLMVGSDFLDELVAAFPHAQPPLRDFFIVVTYLSLLSLTQTGHSNASLLYDHLYILKADGEKGASKTLISAVVSSTSLLKRIETSPVIQDQVRIKELVNALRAFRFPTSTRRGKKGKGKERMNREHDANLGNVHVHRMSLISQIQDLFPELGTAFVASLLSEYNDDVEQATLHLLENSLPDHLANADRAENLATNPAEQNHIDFSPATTPPPERRNVFDDDELDRLDVDTTRLHIGKRERLIDNEEPDKAAIISALAAFDSDDDERDDTYDVEDVGGTVDVAVSEADQVGVVENEASLFRAFKQDPKVFERNASTRRSQERATLRRETGLTDEAIEGWLLVTNRDARKMRRLEVKYSTWTGQQRELQSTAWRQSPAVSGGEDSEATSDIRRSHRGSSSRGHYRGDPRTSRGGRGGSVAGPSDETNTQQARQRKEASKGSRANHNRRDQRAKKMARGGFVA